MDPQTAVLIIAHGSRHDEANADTFHVIAGLRQRGCYRVIEAAFLELAQPTIAESAGACVRQGATRVIMLPYFLSAGVHVERDLRAHCEQLAQQFPGVDFYLAQPLGRHPLLLEIVAERLGQAEEAQQGDSTSR